MLVCLRTLHPCIVAEIILRTGPFIDISIPTLCAGG